MTADDIARLNVICTVEELQEWKLKAKRLHFKTLSDYVRAALNEPQASGLNVRERQKLRKLLQVIER